MDILHFISNNILTKFFKELTKYKNDYQYYLNYIYIGIILYIFKYIYIYMYGVTSQYDYNNKEHLNKLKINPFLQKKIKRKQVDNKADFRL